MSLCKNENEMSLSTVKSSTETCVGSDRTFVQALQEEQDLQGCCWGDVGKALEESVRESSTALPGMEETWSGAWEEFGNAVAQSMLHFTGSLQLVNISESGGKHLSRIPATHFSALQALFEMVIQVGTSMSLG